MAGCIAGMVRWPNLEKWPVEVIDDTANMIWKGIQENDTEVLEMLEKSYKEMGGKVFPKERDVWQDYLNERHGKAGK